MYVTGRWKVRDIPSFNEPDGRSHDVSCSSSDKGHTPGVTDFTLHSGAVRTFVKRSDSREGVDA